MTAEQKITETNDSAFLFKQDLVSRFNPKSTIGQFITNAASIEIEPGNILHILSGNEERFLWYESYPEKSRWYGIWSTSRKVWNTREKFQNEAQAVVDEPDAHVVTFMGELGEELRSSQSVMVDFYHKGFVIQGKANDEVKNVPRRHIQVVSPSEPEASISQELVPRGVSFTAHFIASGTETPMVEVVQRFSDGHEDTMTMPIQIPPPEEYMLRGFIM